MCTVTWWSGSADYEVFFNRDELKSRAEALPPSVSTCGSTRYLAPTDPEAGGTWILVNEYGLTVALLNLYEEETGARDSSGPWRSRGLLLRSLADCRDHEEVATRMKELDAANYNAFTLMAFQPAPDLVVAVWQNRPANPEGSRLSGPSFQPSMPVSSSSFATGDVIQARRKAFEDLVPLDAASPDSLRRFHHFDNHGVPSAYSVLMNRPDAQTWAISHLRVTPESVTFFHESFGKNQTGSPSESELALPRINAPSG